MPRQCVAIDLEKVNRIIALKEPEHRSLVCLRFSRMGVGIHFWNVEDVEYVRWIMRNASLSVARSNSEALRHAAPLDNGFCFAELGCKDNFLVE